MMQIGGILIANTDHFPVSVSSYIPSFRLAAESVGYFAFLFSLSNICVFLGAVGLLRFFILRDDLA